MNYCNRVIRNRIINKRQWYELNFALELCKQFDIDPLFDLYKLPSLPVKSIDFPCTSAFYFFFQENKVLYLGKAKNLRQRINQHLKSNRKEKLNNPSVQVAWMQINSIQLLAIAEIIEIYFMSRFYPSLNLSDNIYKPCPLMLSKHFKM